MKVLYLGATREGINRVAAMTTIIGIAANVVGEVRLALMYIDCFA